MSAIELTPEDINTLIQLCNLRKQVMEKNIFHTPMNRNAATLDAYSRLLVVRQKLLIQSSQLVATTNSTS